MLYGKRKLRHYYLMMRKGIEQAAGKTWAGHDAIKRGKGKRLEEVRYVKLSSGVSAWSELRHASVSLTVPLFA